MAHNDTVLEKHGLFTLYPNLYDPSVSGCNVDIVALHGLNGNAFKTWTDEDNHLWLRDSLPEHVPNARIMTFGYDSALRGSSTRMTVFDFSQDLLVRLSAARQHSTESQRPLIFLCHSLGGIVLKQALIMAHLDGGAYKTIVETTSGIMFFGTPHRGSRAASTGKILSRIVNVASMSRTFRSDLLETLQISSQLLHHISHLSSNILSGMSIVSFYEQKPLRGSVIVEPFSAILGYANERTIPINADHRGISRCSPRRPHQYLPVWSSLKEIVEKSLLESRAEYDDLMRHLFCVDYKTAQLRPRAPHRGTCDWIFENETFRGWLDSPHSAVLLLSAPPGFGKTVLTRHVLEKVLAGWQTYSDGTSINPGVGFFCSFNEQISTSGETILRSLLHQLLQLNPRAQHIVCNRLQDRDRFSMVYNLTSEKLWLAIHDVLSMNNMTNTFICIDAIEELNEEDCRTILRGFNDLVETMNSNPMHSHRIRVFLSSRPSAQYGFTHPQMHILRANKQHTESGIRHYLTNSIAEYCAREPSFAQAMTHRGSDSIVKKILQRADGMFLWATVAWENFSRGLFWNEDIFEQRLLDLESTPSGINALYNNILNQIDPDLRKDMWSLFSIMAVAKIPLMERELSEVLAVILSYRDEVLNPSGIRPVPNLSRIIEKHFLDFITVHDDGTILFSHLSFKEYLLQTWAVDRPELLEKARVGITRACLAYIVYWNQLLPNNDEQHPPNLHLIEYAVSHHLSHLASLSIDNPLWLTYAEASSSDYFIGKSITPLHPLFDRSFRSERLMPIRKCHDIVRLFVAHGYDLDQKESNRNGSILNYCCYGSGNEGFRLTVPLLLELGADPNLHPLGKDANLKAVLLCNEHDVATTLLKHRKFDPNRIDSQKQSALHHLVELGTDQAIFSLLQSRAVEINIQDRAGSTPLHIAVARQRQDVVRQLLLTPSIRLDIFDDNGRTPLALATWWGLSQIALIIIERSEAFPIPETSAVSPLLAAARHGEEDVVKAILPKTRYRHIGRHVDQSGKGFLHHATMNDWHDVIRQCLDLSDINVDQIDHSGSTALHYGAKLGCTESCRVLLHYNASTRIQDRIGRNAAQLAAEAGFKDTLKLILTEENTDANQHDHQGRNLVHWAATLDCLDVMELICRQPDVNVAKRDNSGKMPIDYAWSCQCPSVGRFLSREMRRKGLLEPWVDLYNWDDVFEGARARYLENKRRADMVREASQKAEKERSEKEREMWDEKWALVTTSKDAVNLDSAGDFENPNMQSKE